jgi:VanZ family protein
MRTDSRWDDLVSPRIRLSIWFVGFAIWTYLLVVPVDWLPAFLRGTGPSTWFSFGKLGHAMAFATLTALVPLAASSFRGRLAMWGLLSFHAFLTEFIQTFVPTRTGQWMDVGIDHFGILMGFALLAGLRSWQRKLPAVKTEQYSRRENQNADLLGHR